jgi:hypothetical protein
METILNKLKQKYTLEQSKKSVEDIVTPIFLKLCLYEAVSRFNTVPEEYRTDWTKLLMDVDKSRGVLTTLLQALFGVYSGEMVGFLDLDVTMAPRLVTQIFANTKDKIQQKKLVDLIQQVLGNSYIVKLVNSDETSNREVEAEVKNLVERAKRENKRLVIVSKEMGSRSLSVPEIDTEMLMYDRGSCFTTTQKVSRGLTPGKLLDGQTKKFGYIISLSLDPNREDYNPIDEYIIHEAEKVEVDDLNDGIHRVLRSVQLFTNGPHGEIELEKDQYAEKLLNSSSLIRIGAESSKVDNIIDDTDLVNKLLGIEISKTEKEKLFGIDSDTIVRSDKPEKIKEYEKTEKKIEDIKFRLKEFLKNIVENIVEISEINNCESNDIIQTLDMIESKGYSEEVVFEVGVDCKTVKKIISMGGVSHKLLNTIITSYNKQENNLYS